MQVAADRAFDQTKTVLPTEVARGIFMQHAPSLQALKLMHLMIATAGGRMAEDVQHQFRLADIKAIEGMRNHNRESLIPLFQELASTVLTHDDPSKMIVVIGGILDEARIDYRNEVSGDLLVSWYFRRTFRRMAEESNHWAILDRQTVFHLGSRYSVLLFQHIASLVPLEHVSSRTFTVPELRALLGVPEGKLERFSNLMQKALKPAIEEISQLSRFTLLATPNKVGRTVSSVTIAWEEKPFEGKKEVRKELDRPRAGRSARRTGMAEAVVATPSTPVSESKGFPVSGGVHYGRWAEVARAHLPKPTPDLDMVATSFRQWVAAKGLSLDSSAVERAFIGFCAKWRG